MKTGDKVKVIDRRDGAVIVKGAVASVADGYVRVVGKYSPEAFGDSVLSDTDADVTVPQSCVEKLEAS